MEARSPRGDEAAPARLGGQGFTGINGASLRRPDPQFTRRPPAPKGVATHPASTSKVPEAHFLSSPRSLAGTVREIPNTRTCRSSASRDHLSDGKLEVRRTASLALTSRSIVSCSTRQPCMEASNRPLGQGRGGLAIADADAPQSHSSVRPSWIASAQSTRCSSVAASWPRTSTIRSFATVRT